MTVKQHFYSTISDKCANLSKRPMGYPSTSHPKPTTSIDLTRIQDFTTIVIPKKQTKPRRKRTAFSNIQLHFLEQFFQKKAYPSSQERNFIGSILNIGSGQVKTWYQNRRTKMKKNKVFDFGNKIQEPTMSSPLEGDTIRVGQSQLRTIPSLSGTLETNVKCFDLGNKQPYTMPTMASLKGRTSMSEMHCDCYTPTCIGSNLLLQQRSMMGQN